MEFAHEVYVDKKAEPQKALSIVVDCPNKAADIRNEKPFFFFTNSSANFLSF